jgi:hypothetical protein
MIKRWFKQTIVSRRSKAADTFDVPEWVNGAAEISQLHVCAVCKSTFVHPVSWEEREEGQWWMDLRCGQCAAHRQILVSDDAARRYDRQLTSDAHDMAIAARRLDSEQMADSVDRFINALHSDLIVPDDF